MTPGDPGSGTGRTVVILCDPEDEHALHVQRVLTERGHRGLLLDSFDFPGELQISLRPGEAGEVTLPDGTLVDWGDVHSIYWRNYNGVAPSALPDDEQAHIAQNDSRSLFESMLIRWRARWVNGWDAYRLHQTKPAQLDIVRSLELPRAVRVPATLLTNDPQAVLDFAAEHPNCIFKPVQGGAHTRPLTADHLTDAHLDNLHHAPVTVQQRIDGADIRVFLAGDRLHACRLDTEALDFREDPDVLIEPVDLPAPVADACRRIAASLHLLWTGIDLRLADDGLYYFFEANPSPMFLGFESRCPLPLTDALIHLLTD
jgi:hypothetical protein